MPDASNKELIERWADEEAPLLPTLHAFHERDGFLSEEALRTISSGLKIPLAELFGTVSFYHHLSREPEGFRAPRVCTGNICCLHGGNEVLEALRKEGARPMPCAGRCDEPTPVLREHDVFTGSTKGLELRPSPVPRPDLSGCEECIFAHIRSPEQASLGGYRATDGYRGLQQALEESAARVLDIIKESGLAGRGGAGFPTGVKWQAVADAPGVPKSIVCNADEGEPGCFKDRAIMDLDPHAVIEGMAIAAHATGATRGFIYLRYEYPGTYRVLDRALTEAREAGFLGKTLGGALDFDIFLRRGAGAYICGEEGSLLNSLEGKRPLPRNRPPFPVTHGYEDLPTVVNNVETLASVPKILFRGAAWYQGLGLGDSAGTKLISLSGDIQHPGNYEVPIGYSLEKLLYERAGGPPAGRSIQAVTMAGLSGGFLGGKDLSVTLDEASLREKSSFLGAGGIIVFDDTRDMVEMAHNAMEFFAEESCGKCFPCRIGTQRLTERLNGRGPTEPGLWIEEVEDIGRTMMATSACGLGTAAPNITQSLLKYFPEQVARHLGDR